MPVRKNKQLNDMHELLQQLEVLHAEHDLDHLAGGSEGKAWWKKAIEGVKKTINDTKKAHETSKAIKAAEKKDAETKQTETEEKWKEFDLQKKKNILTQYFKTKIDNTYVSIFNGILPATHHDEPPEAKKNEIIQYIEQRTQEQHIQSIIDIISNNNFLKTQWQDFILKHQYTD